jgi:SAM-dependent methyltransferase
MTESESLHKPSLPAILNLGSGKDFRADHFNIDIDPAWSPDAVCDLSRVTTLSAGVAFKTQRFGDIVLRPGSFDTIVANDVLEHVPDLMAMMTNCLSLLKTGGVFEISVPYDLSYGAWQDPTHVRAFNERSWLYYTEWFWYMGWSEFRFELDGFNFVPSAIGEALRAKNMDREEILRTPRAIDSMSVRLRKIALSADDQLVWEFHRQKKQTARSVTHIAVQESAPLKAFDGSFHELRDRYCIWIVTPANYTHQRAYDDLALGLSEAFSELGGSAPVIRDPAHANGRELIVMGPQLLPPSASTLLPASSILFNLEQADHKSPWMTEPYLALLRQRPLLDYSVRNQAALQAMGMSHARLLPVGYAPGLSRVRHAAVKDIDVLFYGSLNERRSAILNELTRQGVKVTSLFDAYGADRDDAIGRAKIVLNVHFYDAAIFESVRVSYLLANGVCVLTEGDAHDPDLAPLGSGLAVEPYHRLVSRCLGLLKNDAERVHLARNGFAAMQSRSQSRLLKALFQ